MDRVAIVTGGAGSIGSSIAAQFAREGDDVVLMDIRETAANEVAARIREDGGRVHIRVADARNREQMHDLARDIVLRFGRIDVLVNVAGGHTALGLQRRPFHETSPDEWDIEIGVNLVGTLNCTFAVVPQMLAQRAGAIVNIASAHGLRAGPRLAVYAATKAAIIVFSRSLAVELGPSGIRVNCVAPGWVIARWQGPEMEVDKISQTPPLGKFATPDDVAHAVLFLASSRAAHISGACLDVSGGSTLH